MFAIKLDLTLPSATNADQPSRSKAPIIDTALETLQAQDSSPGCLNFKAKKFEVDFRLLKLYSKTFNSHWVYIRPEGDIGVDLDIDPFHVKQLMNFLGGGELQITAQNILGLLDAASYFDVPIFLEQLISKADKFAECLEAASQEQVVDYSQILNLMIGYEYSRERQLEFISQLKISPELRTTLVDNVSGHSNAIIQILIDIQKELVKGKPLKESPSYKKFVSALPNISPKNLKVVLGYLSESKILKEPLCRKVFKTLMMAKNNENGDFWRTYKNILAEPGLDPIINNLCEMGKDFVKIHTALNEDWNMEAQIIKIKDHTDALNRKMQEFDDAKTKLIAAKKVKVVENTLPLKILQKASLKILDNLMKAAEIRKDKVKIAKILLGIFVTLMVLTALACLAMGIFYVATKVPKGIPYWAEGRYGMERITPLLFRSVDKVAASFLFTGIATGPLMLAAIWMVFRKVFRTNEKVKKKHILRDIQLELDKA